MNAIDRSAITRHLSGLCLTAIVSTMLVVLITHAQNSEGLTLITDVISGGGQGVTVNGIVTSTGNAGDVNGDGYPDIIFGNFFNNVGGASVVFGGPGLRSDIDLSSLDGNNGFSMSGISPKDGTGFSVSGAGDTNDDGLGDLIISAPPRAQVTGKGIREKCMWCMANPASRRVLIYPN